MKRVFFVGLALTILVVLPVGVALRSRGAEAVNFKINKKDFPERGLTIITAADPSFDSLMAAYLDRHPDARTLVGRLKPFSFFVRNNTPQAVVACRVKWECVKADGAVIDKVTGLTSLWALTNTLGDKTEASIAHADMVIRPGTARFFSLAAPSESLDERHVSDIRVEEKDEMLRDLRSEFMAYTDVTVSIDGAFFYDGGFVGLDTTGLFDEVKAQVDARHKLLTEARRAALKAGRIQGAYEFIEVAANAPQITIRGRSTPEQHYLRERKLMAQELLYIRKNKGDDKLLDEVNLHLSRKWPTLRKL